MRLYHYRSIKSAILEIENGTFHFASREELNDPLEGYVRVYWQGDKAAWEGLFKNYVCSVNQALSLYLLAANEEILHHHTLVVDLHRYEDVPLGEILNDLSDKFLADTEIKKLITFYGDKKLKVRKEELKMIFNIAHRKALALCIRSGIENHTLSEEAGDFWHKIFEKDGPLLPAGILQKDLFDEAQRAAIMKLTEDMIEDMIEFSFMKMGAETEGFLYGNKLESDGKIKNARIHRNWLSIAVDFPKMYVDQLTEIIYPKGFMVCFSGKNNDSSMWGNYADNHKGVCLIYETDSNCAINIEMPDRTYSMEVRKIDYGGELIERNFFETLGCLTKLQIKDWLTGTDGISSSYEVFSNKEEWRKRYWDAFEAKNYRKLKAWEHEDEYRMVIDDTFYRFGDSESRNLKYDGKALKGIIFGINTSEHDKKKILEKLFEKNNSLEEYFFQQAEYDEEKQTITVRDKIGWKLLKKNCI